MTFIEWFDSKWTNVAILVFMTLQLIHMENDPIWWRVIHHSAMFLLFLSTIYRFSVESKKE